MPLYQLVDTTSSPEKVLREKIEAKNRKEAAVRARSATGCPRTFRIRRDPSTPVPPPPPKAPYVSKRKAKATPAPKPKKGR